MFHPVKHYEHPFKMWKLWYLLAISLVITPISVTGQNLDLNETVASLIQVAEMYSSILTNESLDTCTKYMGLLVGWLPDPGKVDTVSYYSILTQAYHYGYPSVGRWAEAQQDLEDTRPHMIKIREVQEDWEKIRALELHCQVLASNNTNESSSSLDDFGVAEQYKNKFTACVDNDLVSEMNNSEVFATRLYTSCLRALKITAEAFLYSTSSFTYSGRFTSTVYLDLFTMIYQAAVRVDQDIQNRTTDTFPKYIETVRETDPQHADMLQEKLDEIIARITDETLPYHQMFFKGDVTEMDNLWANNEAQTGIYDFSNDMYSLFDDGTENSMNYNLFLWVNDLQGFITALGDGTVEGYVGGLTDLFERYLNVSPSIENERNDNGVLVGDGKWNWDIDKGIQNLRLAWDLMDAVAEELKCYMKDTYYFDLRQDVLKQTQLNVTEGALFSGISTTLNMPCEIENDRDIVTRYCTRENHEICSPMTPLDTRQRTDSIHHTGLSLTRPKWVFKYDKNQMKCVGRKDFIMKYFRCRCGFRLDCGKDLGVNITCVLEPNDYLRGQCRGSVAYPCKTLPLSPKMHNQTCASGYCNMKKNSCEERINAYINTNDGYKWSANTVSWIISIFLSILSLYV